MALNTNQNRPPSGGLFSGFGGFFTRRSGGNRFDIKDLFTYTYLILGTIIMFGPVVWLVMSSFKDQSLLFESNPTFLPYRQVTTQIQHETILEFNPNFYQISVGGSRIIAPDMPAENGLIHGLDRLIISPDQRATIRALSLEGVDTSDLPRAITRIELEGETGSALALLQDNRDYGLFMALLEAVGLDESLATDNITVFAPNNLAIERFIRETRPEYIAALWQPQNHDLLRAILAPHIVSGQHSLFDLFNYRADPAALRLPILDSDQTLQASVGAGGAMPLYDVTFNDLYINNAKLVTRDQIATNGILHSLDTVLIPSDLAEAFAALGLSSEALSAESIPLDQALNLDTEADLTLADFLNVAPDLSRFAALVETAGLNELLADPESDLTLFAPTNAAIEAWLAGQGEGVAAALLLPENAALLQSFVRYHILTDRYRYVNFFRNLTNPLTTLHADETVNLHLEEGTTERLAQIGSPRGAEYFVIDPENPAAGIRSVFVFVSPDGNSVNFTPLREVYFKFENYTEALNTFDFTTYLYNTVVVTVVATVITLLINSMAAFGLSKYRFKGRDAVFLIIISTLMVPVSVILVPAFFVISRLGMTNSLWGLIIPGAATPTGVFLLRQYMLTIPDELLDAARIDGASEWRIYWQIILPLARPALAVLAIFSVMWRWNDFLWPLIVVSQNDKFTLQVALNAFQGALDVQWHYILAMTVLTLLPISLVFAILQRYITTGIATTGLK